MTFEEGTWAAWLYDLIKPHVAELVVCNPRKNALLKHGNKSDKIDARKLADRLRIEQVLCKVLSVRNGPSEKIHQDLLLGRIVRVIRHEYPRETGYRVDVLAYSIADGDPEICWHFLYGTPRTTC